MPHHDNVRQQSVGDLGPSIKVYRSELRLLKSI